MQTALGITQLALQCSSRVILNFYVVLPDSVCSSCQTQKEVFSR